MFKLDPKLAAIVGLDMALSGNAFVLVDNCGKQQRLSPSDVECHSGEDGYYLRTKRRDGSMERTRFYDKAIWHAKMVEVNVPDGANANTD